MAAPTSPVPFSLAEGSDPHEPFTPGALGLNTPTKRAQTSEIWTKKMAMRIRGETGRAQALRTQGYTHPRVRPQARQRLALQPRAQAHEGPVRHLAHHGLHPQG